MDSENSFLRYPVNSAKSFSPLNLAKIGRGSMMLDKTKLIVFKTEVARC